MAVKVLLHLVVILQVVTFVTAVGSLSQQEPLERYSMNESSANWKAQFYGQKEFVSHVYHARFVELADSYGKVDFEQYLPLRRSQESVK